MTSQIPSRLEFLRESSLFAEAFARTLPLVFGPLIIQQWAGQSVSQSVSQPASQPASHPVCIQSFNQSVSQSIDQSIYQFNQSVSQPLLHEKAGLASTLSFVIAHLQTDRPNRMFFPPSILFFNSVFLPSFIPPSIPPSLPPSLPPFLPSFPQLSGRGVGPGGSRVGRGLLGLQRGHHHRHGPWPVGAA